MRVGAAVAGGCLGPFVVVWGVLAGGMVALFGGILLAVADGPSPVLAVVAGVLVAVLVGALGVRLGQGGRPDRALVAAVDRTEVRRGDEVRARLERGAGDVELGLLCVVHYDRWTRTGSEGSSSRSTSRKAVVQEWVPASGVDVAFRVPVDAPCSYEGDAVSFAWSVRARRVGRERLSEPAPIWVAP